MQYTKEGVKLYCGNSFKLYRTFSHLGVTSANFSPKESYLVTYSPSAKPSEQIIIWDVLTGIPLRHFSLPKHIPSQLGSKLFQWSFDETLVAAMLRQNYLHIYTVEDMKLLNHKPLKHPNIVSFSFSPTEPFFAVVRGSTGPGSPHMVYLHQFSALKILRNVSLYDVDSISLLWHPQGRYLAVRSEMTKKSTVPNAPVSITTTMTLFRIQCTGIPIESLSFPSSFYKFAWEPHGSKFGVAFKTRLRYDFEFFDMKPNKSQDEASQKSAAILKVENKRLNQIVWSPTGRFCALAGVGLPGGSIEFWDIPKGTCISTQSHTRMTSIEWNCTGRFVTSTTSCLVLPDAAEDTMYQIYTLDGRLSIRHVERGLKQFLWRPRLEPLLSKKQQQKIRKNLPKYAQKYLAIDKELFAGTQAGLQIEQQEAAHEWRQYWQRRIAEFNSPDQKQAREAIRGCPSDDEDDEDQWVEFYDLSTNSSESPEAEPTHQIGEEEDQSAPPGPSQAM